MTRVINEVGDWRLRTLWNPNWLPQIFVVRILQGNQKMRPSIGSFAQECLFFWEAMAGEQSLTVHWATKKASGGNNAKSVRIKTEICLRIQQTYCLKINKDLFAVKTKRGKMTNEQSTKSKQWHSPPVWYLVHEWPVQKDIFAMLREASWWQRHQKRQSTRTYNWKEWNAKILTLCLM